VELERRQAMRLFTRMGLVRHNDEERRKWIRWAYEQVGAEPPREGFEELDVMAALQFRKDALAGATPETREILFDVGRIAQQLRESMQPDPKFEEAIAKLDRLAGRRVRFRFST
jgi:hypothetical protein